MSPAGSVFPFVRPYLPVIAAAWMAAALHAVLDAGTLVLLIPFVETVFGAGGAAPSAASAGTGMEDLLGATIYHWIDVDGDPLSAVGRIIGVIVVLFALKNGFAFLRDLLAATLEEGVSRDVTRRLYDRILHAELAFFGRARSGDLVGRLTAECDRLRSFVGGGLTRLASASTLVVACVVAMALISWRLTLAACVVVPLLALLWSPMVARLRLRERATAALGADRSARVSETVSMIRVIKAFSSEAREMERFGALTGQHHASRIGAARWRALIAPATEMLATAGTVAILWFGARLVVAEELGAASFVAFLALSMRVFSPVKAVANFPALAMPGVVAAERLQELLDLPGDLADAAPVGTSPTKDLAEVVPVAGSPPGDLAETAQVASSPPKDPGTTAPVPTERAGAGELNPAGGGRDASRSRAASPPPPVLEREIAFENVSFSHPGGVGGVRGVSFSVARGRAVAIVGPSGAGKSTLVDLLARFVEPEGGRITIDGADARTWKKKDWRSLMALVPQGGSLFNGTVGFNIAYGRPGATASEIEAAAAVASAHAFISRLPDGYDSNVGEGGANLSAGERQRISLARAILADRPLLVLDEATSDLDPGSEREVGYAIRAAFRHRTVIVIAHRLSTIRLADEIVVLDHGRVAEMGGHQQLMELNGLYRRLHGAEPSAPS